MFIVTLCHLVVPFGKSFSNKSQRHLPHCSAKKWLALTSKHRYEDFSHWEALTFVNAAKLVDAIARPLQAAIRLLVFHKTICFRLPKEKGFEQIYFIAKSWEFIS